jgi:integrase
MTRRSRGEGSVYYDRSRRVWTGSVEVGRDPVEGTRLRRKVSAPTKTELLARLDDLKHERRRTGTVGPRNAMVAHVVRAYMASPPASWRSPVTFAVNRQHAKMITAGLGRVKLADLTAGDVEAFLHALAAPRKGRKGLSASTIRNVRGLLRAALRRAERDGLVGRNAAAVATLPRAPRRRSKALTLAQADALLALDLDPWWRAFLICGMALGLRPGELLGLRWQDVDFGGNVVRVRRSLKYDRDTHRQVLDDLKTEGSHRTLAMPRAVSGTLRAHKAAQARSRLASREYGAMGLVFAGKDGRPMWSKTVGYGLARLCERAAVPVITMHELRHTFVSIASAAGVSIEDIADAAGHVNPTVTRAVYRHVIADKVTRTSEAMDTIFGEGYGG